jgi:hypothetical protein
MNPESNHESPAICFNSEISAGSILPIDYLRDYIPVIRYFKKENKTGELIPSLGDNGVDLNNLQDAHDFFEVGKLSSSLKKRINSELVDPAKKNLELLITDFKKKLQDKHFLNGICHSNPLKKQFLDCLEEIYNDHLTVLNIKKLNDSNKKVLEQSLDICALATILAIRSNVLPQEIDTICKGSLLINIGKTQVPAHENAKHIDEGCKYLKILGYDETIINIVRFKSSFEKITPEPKLIIGIVKASYLYHLSLNKYQPDNIIGTIDSHSATLKKLKTYVTLKYMNLRIYRLLVRVFNESAV